MDFSSHEELTGKHREGRTEKQGIAKTRGNETMKYSKPEVTRVDVGTGAIQSSTAKDGLLLDVQQDQKPANWVTAPSYESDE
jgi:hypothetical protein